MWLSDLSILITGQQTNLHIPASVAGVLSVGVLYCFGGGTARRVGTSQWIFTRGFAVHFASAGKKVPWA